MEWVSWEAAQAFCLKLSEQTMQTVQLPTEAEWEYACRAGTTTIFNSGDTKSDLDRGAWHVKNSKVTTHPVRQKEANNFGLFDMYGNVWEWCADWYGAYPAEAVKDPKREDSGYFRVLRGGSWRSSPGNCRSANRGYDAPGFCYYYFGFRIVMRVSSRTQ